MPRPKHSHDSEEPKSKPSSTSASNPSSSNNSNLAKKRFKQKGTSEDDLNRFADKVFGGKNTRNKSDKKSNVDKPKIDPANHEFSNVFINSLLAIDASLSRLLAICSQPGSLFRPCAILLEWSGHGVPWFVVIVYMLCSTPIAERSRLYILYNYLFGLILDVICVGLIKSLVRRKRPSYNHSGDMHTFVKADNFSFPSGHASRVTLMAILTVNFFTSMSFPSKVLTCSWAFWVCLSRVMLGRHYLSDITAGALLSFGLYQVLRRGLFLNDAVVYQLHRIVKSFIG